ncbi:MAG: hypothetical protein M3Q58_09220 [Bacteroidota bacterium]|nr:hypothetical protein [Bacteroidota bacterium]
MFEKILNSSVLKSKNIAGVEIVFLSEGGLHFNLVILKKAKSGIDVQNVYIGIKNIEELQNKLDLRLPINIVINGKGVIHKKVILNKGENENKLIEKVFPNAKINDFYLQKTELSGNTVFASLVRKKTIDELLATFTNKGYFFSAIFLGPFCINGIIPLINPSSENLSLGSFKFSLHNSEFIDDFQDNNFFLSNEKISIAGEEINQQAVIAFAGAFQYFFPYTGDVLMNVPVVTESNNELKQKKFFELGGWAVLIVFLTGLLFNFMLFKYYEKQFQQLNTAFSGKKEQLELVNELKIKVKDKQIFLEKTGLKGVSKTSYYADRIALDLPETIILTQLHIHPSENKIKNDETPVFLSKVIIVKGSCKKSTELNEWIRSIKKMAWVNDISVISYKQENMANIGEFEIKITIV